MINGLEQEKSTAIKTALNNFIEIRGKDPAKQSFVTNTKNAMRLLDGAMKEKKEEVIPTIGVTKKSTDNPAKFKREADARNNKRFPKKDLSSASPLISNKSSVISNGMPPQPNREPPVPTKEMIEAKEKREIAKQVVGELSNLWNSAIKDETNDSDNGKEGDNSGRTTPEARSRSSSNDSPNNEGLEGVQLIGLPAKNIRKDVEAKSSVKAAENESKILSSKDDNVLTKKNRMIDTLYAKGTTQAGDLIAPPKKITTVTSSKKQERGGGKER